MWARPVILLFGGENSERLVSVATAQNLALHRPDAQLWHWRREGEVVAVERDALLAHASPFEIEFTAPGRILARGPSEMAVAARAIDGVLLLGLHGGAAENGDLAAICETTGVPFTGSGSQASRIAFDKIAAKARVGAAGIRTSASLRLRGAQDGKQLNAWLRRFGRLCAKPVADGSSVGLRFISTLTEAADLLGALDQPYLIEPFMAGREATVGVVDGPNGPRALPPVEILPAAGRTFDYAGKYLGRGVEERCPADFDEGVDEQLRQHALVAHQRIGAYGYSRSDFIVTARGPVFLETNTLPGLTATSLLPLALRASDISLNAFLDGQLDLALRRPTASQDAVN